MMKITSLGLVLAMTAFAGCGDDKDGECETPIDGSGSAGSDGSGSGQVTYKQIEHLGRPGIAEALLLTNGYLAGYNATAPTFTGVPPATLDLVVGEAKVVLKAIYYGVCFVNGQATLTAGPNGTGLKPARQACPNVGTDIFSDLTGTGTLRPAMVAAAQAYADLVFSQFEPDVLRIDTALTSGYLADPNGNLALCAGLAANKPLLCGGRVLTDDVIDITYNYLLAGALIDASSPPQFKALVSDGVSYAGSNSNQGHPAPSETFPYSAAPI